MFFQLPEIERLSSRISELAKEKQSLNSALTQSFSQGNRVRKSVGVTISDIIEKAKKDLDVCGNVQEQAQNGYLIPEDFQIEQLVYDKSQLPEWFEYVFKKEYAKEKKNFDITAKKMYKLHGLREKKNQLQNQIKSFEILYQRYEALDQTEKNCLNIMGEAETLKNKASAVTQRFANYLHLVTSKIVAFLQQNIAKALNYSAQIGDYSQKTHHPVNIIHQNKPKDFKMYNQSVLTMPTYKPPPTMIPNRQYTYTENRIPTFPQTRIQTSPSNFCHHHHRPMRSVGFQESRFNYRQHMPRWMNKTLSSYYI